MNPILLLVASASLAQQPAPNLAEEVRSGVAQMQSQLPIRQGPVTIDRIEADGVSIIFHMQVSAGAPEFERRFRESLPVQACMNDEARSFFQRGGRYVYHVQAPGVPAFTASVDHC